MLQDPLQRAPCPTSVLVTMRDKSKQFSVVIVARYSSFPKLQAVRSHIVNSDFKSGSVWNLSGTGWWKDTRPCTSTKRSEPERVDRGRVEASGTAR